MSGSGGGGYGGGPSYSSPCDTLRFDSQLSSPQASVVATLRSGDVMAIAVAQMNGQVVVQVLSHGQPAGGLTGPEATQLRNCIEQGHDFNATVLQVNGGQVRVRVEHA